MAYDPLMSFQFKFIFILSTIINCLPRLSFEHLVGLSIQTYNGCNVTATRAFMVFDKGFFFKKKKSYPNMLFMFI